MVYYCFVYQHGHIITWLKTIYSTFKMHLIFFTANGYILSFSRVTVNFFWRFRVLWLTPLGFSVFSMNIMDISSFRAVFNHVFWKIATFKNKVLAG